MDRSSSFCSHSQSDRSRYQAIGLVIEVSASSVAFAWARACGAAYPLRREDHARIRAALDARATALQGASARG